MIISVIPAGLRTAVRSWLAMRWGQRHAKSGIKIFQETLQEFGLPEVAIHELVSQYKSTVNLLSIRGLSQLVFRSIRWRGSQ
ncbi:MAG: hypothetical protein ACFFBU_03725 [Promethearchaeota archaeon]